MKQVYINLPVKDLGKATSFYEKLGFVVVPEFSNEKASGLKWSDTIFIMLLSSDFYKEFIPNKEICDLSKFSASAICLSIDSKAEVDRLATLAVENGGNTYTVEMNQQNGMYGISIEDLDGHLLELIYMS